MHNRYRNKPRRQQRVKEAAARKKAYDEKYPRQTAQATNDQSLVVKKVEPVKKAVQARERRMKKASV